MQASGTAVFDNFCRSLLQHRATARLVCDFSAGVLRDRSAPDHGWPRAAFATLIGVNNGVLFKKDGPRMRRAAWRLSWQCQSDCSACLALLLFQYRPEAELSGS